VEPVKTLNEYQEAAGKIALYPGADMRLTEQIAAKMTRSFAPLLDGLTDVVEYERVRLGIVQMLACARLSGLLYVALGVNGEAGEFAEKVKKLLRDKNGELTDELRECLAQELGDIQWFVSEAARQLKFTLEEIANKNITKLFDRLDRGMIGGDGDNR